MLVIEKPIIWNISTADQEDIKLTQKIQLKKEFLTSGNKDSLEEVKVYFTYSKKAMYAFYHVKEKLNSNCL